MSKRELLNKQEMPTGPVGAGGTMARLYTGSWRTYIPLTDLEKCTHCMICWIMCPDSAIVVKDGKKLGTNYQYCKGCGVCAVECPVDAIQMKLESDVSAQEKQREDVRA